MSAELTTLSSGTVDLYYRNNPKYRGCLFYQDITSLGNGFWFVNINNAHWMLLFNNSETATVSFMDPFGTFPMDNIIRLMRNSKRQVSISSKAVQGAHQRNCGWICMYVCDQLLKNRLLEDVMADFSNNPVQNELKLRKYFEYVSKGDGTALDGDGIVDFILDREPLSVKLFMMRYGSEPIEYLEIVRVPVIGAVQKLANWISNGELEKNKQKLGYDDMFHLFLIVNRKWRWERNQTVDISRDTSYFAKKGAQVQVVSRFKNKAKSMKELLSNAAKKNGEKFWRYDAKTNNCQVFVQQVLDASGMWDYSTRHFTIQETDTLLTKELSKKLGYITDLGGVVSKLTSYMPWVSWASNLKGLFSL